MEKNDKNKHFASIIIPTFGRAATLGQTKRALDKQTRKPDEIIIIHDKEMKGPGWGRNKGIAKSKGDLIGFVDHDCVPEPDWLEKLIDSIDKNNADGVGGTYTETDSLLNAIRLRRNFPVEECADATVFVGIGGNILYKRSALISCKEKYGHMFKENFAGYGSEDVELAWRIKLNGGKLFFVPTNSIHLKKVNALSYLRMQFFRGIGIAILNKEYKKMKINLKPQKSRLWNKKGAFKYVVIFWHKCIGPFDMNSFGTFSNFFAFWFGEKVQGIGFFYGMLFEKAKE